MPRREKIVVIAEMCMRYDTMRSQDSLTSMIHFSALQAAVVMLVSSGSSTNLARDTTDGCLVITMHGAAENARPDIARLDNAAPYCKGGHRETCFSVRVDAHYKFMFDSGSII